MTRNLSGIKNLHITSQHYSAGKVFTIMSSTLKKEIIMPRLLINSVNTFINKTAIAKHLQWSKCKRDIICNVLIIGRLRYINAIRKT